MPVYEYSGLDGAGKATRGVVDAESSKAARARLRRTGVFVTDIREQQARATRGSGLNVEVDFRRYLQFITTRDVSTLTTQLSTLIGAHVPIADGLSALVDQADKEKLKVVLSQIKERVNEGMPLADAMAVHPHVFDELYVQMVRAGEKSGALSAVLVRLAKFIDARVRLQGQVRSALAYPLLMTIMGSLILLGLFNFVIPRVRGMFASMGGEETLPLITKVVFFLGDLFTGWWWLIPIFLGLFTLGFRRWVATEGGRMRFDGYKLRAPIVGHLNRLIAVARFCRTLSTLLLSGVPILGALAIVEGTVGNKVIAKAIREAAVNIQEGQSVAAPLKASGEFPPLVTHMIAIGERTGELEKMLTVVADSYEEQVEASIGAITSLLAPLMIMIMGGIVFLVALGLLLPMTQLSQMIR